MARPCKNIEAQSRHNSKEYIEKRKETEEMLKGLADRIEFPPEYLTKQQKLIYKEIFNELKASQILSNLDIYILSACSIAIDRLQYIEEVINKNPRALMNKDLMSAKDKYNKDFYRCCNELSLSPQSRAKFGSLSLKAKEKEEDPLIKALKGDEDED
ncbi:phage terminase small subunit P27 family [Clostridium celatum]|uniref:phage terminase small subunit P27 family n=1 Tax=Clostridium celatum TaxID=36834 RepID=UPI0029017DC5|nr:phage terminase small subunit P27 family [Clostridium celatum]MDU2266684.1 phage terminase small subunit P27 family [Clostridium celatum]MDU6297071.1 phage terminase small subunit P27 family [Clostridium celatum]